VVVDDAIVVLEAIYRHIEEGMTPMKAAYKAMEEISFAVIAITVSLVAVFAPLAFQKSTTGGCSEFAMAVSGRSFRVCRADLSPAMAASAQTAGAWRFAIQLVRARLPLARRPWPRPPLACTIASSCLR
jgi:hypothetical protein